MRLVRPLYESLPLLYVVIAALAILVAYLDPDGPRARIAFGIGLLSATAALTVFLHRQDYRAQSREYSHASLDAPSRLKG
ncbi:MAG TPA: hypothetical protein VK437_04840 [Steroidobacteraceae bacterium]|nr:hypothetical protein [Steroidobacteraceae bacterium]